MKPVSTSTMVETLTPIWRRILQLSSVGVDDNFFDLGGDSALALELFHEIALACGRELPPVTIYQAPTIAALAALLEQPVTPRVPALVQLRDGSEEPPVFIAHGLGGSVMDFFQVVKHIQTTHAIHGMQAKGIDGVEEPLDRIEEMARYSLDAIKQLQPHGPYLLVGFSLGGLVALEMAQQLIAEGETIGILVMLDSYPHAESLIARTAPSFVDAANLAPDRRQAAMAWHKPALSNHSRSIPFTSSATFPRHILPRAGTVSAAVLSGQNKLRPSVQFLLTSLPIQPQSGPIWRKNSSFKPYPAIIWES